mgnify:CR=1 FL=1
MQARSTTTNSTTTVWRWTECSVTNPAAGRREVVRLLGELGWSDAGCDDAALLAAELLGNAVRHGEHPVSLRVDADARRCSLHIVDSGGGYPARSDEGADELGGRGLRIVDHLADWWGVTELVGGKAVWAYIRDRPHSSRDDSQDDSALESRHTP